MSNANPSQNPSNYGTLTGLFREAMDKMIAGVDGMLPARVISYNRATNRAQVQPLIMLVTTNNESVARAPVASVPVFQFGGGGHILSFNINAGDLGWIKANDRDISLFLQYFTQSAPNTWRKHSFQDAVFIPDPMRGYTIAEEDQSNCVLQNLDGSVKISLSADTIKIAAPNVEIVSENFTHNGTNVGDTHVHGGVQSGGSNTGVPV